MRKLAVVMSLMATTSMANTTFKGEVPTEVCWFNNQAYGIGSHNPNIGIQFRGTLTADKSGGYGQFCVYRHGVPTWVYMQYDPSQERWMEDNIGAHEQ